MNIFKKQIESCKDNRSYYQHAMRVFSRNLADTMNLSNKDIAHAEDHECVFDIVGFQIAARKFPWNRWEPLLIATPAGVEGGRAGYSNTDIALPKAWHYVQAGTASEILPPQCIQDEILDRVKQAQ